MELVPIAALALFVILPGAIALLQPNMLLSLAERLRSPYGRFWSAGIRLLLGAALWFSADLSRDIELIRIVAGVLMVAGIVTLLVGQKQFEKKLNWVGGWPLTALRAWGILALFTGVWLIGLF